MHWHCVCAGDYPRKRTHESQHKVLQKRHESMIQNVV